MSFAKLKQSLDDDDKPLTKYGRVKFKSSMVGLNMVGDRQYSSTTPKAFRTNFDRFPKKQMHKKGYSPPLQRGWVNLDEVYGYYDDVCEYTGLPQSLNFDEDKR